MAPQVVLNTSVVVFVLPADQADVLPAFEPACDLGVLGIVYRIDKVKSRKSADSRGSGV